MNTKTMMTSNYMDSAPTALKDSITIRERISDKKKGVSKTIQKKEGWISWLFFLGTNRLFKVASTRKLTRRDIGALPEASKAKRAY